MDKKLTPEYEFLRDLRTIAEQLVSRTTKMDERIREDLVMNSKLLEELKMNNRIFPYYLNYPQAAITAATAVRPVDPDVLAVAGAAGYDRIVVYHELNRLSPKCWVINDGGEQAGSILYAVATSNGIKWSGESEILEHESRAFSNVYEIRVRSPDITLNYRTTEYEPGYLA